MPNILITGANGQLGTWMQRLAAGRSHYFFTDITSLDLPGYAVLDITDRDAVAEFVKQHEIQVIVNCAAYTNVDKAEEDYPVADLLNHKAVENLALVCREVNGKLIHVSTDYVFSGEKNIPYKEDDPTAPTGVYGKTKLAGEECIKRVLGETGAYLIFRTAWLYSEYGNNFVKTMRKLTLERERVNVVFDQVGTPTYAGDLAGVIYKIIEESLPVQGVFHFSNEGVCSWYDFAREIARLSGCSCNIQPCHSDEFPGKVKRPSYSVLDKTKLKTVTGLCIPYWKDSLEGCIRELERNKNCNNRT